MRRSAAPLLLALGACALVACANVTRLTRLAMMGDSRELREHDDDAAETKPRAPSILILGIDGMKRDVLYGLLERGELPGLASLLGGRENGRFPHAYFDHRTLAPFPSVTLVGWSSIFSGATPAASGVTGNEFFIREERRFVAPIPGSFDAKQPVLATYTEGYANRLLEVPTVYERLREKDPNVSIWVSVSQFYRGADRLLITQRSALIDMFAATLKDIVDGKVFEAFQQRDLGVLETVIEEVADDDDPVPDVLTVYVSGTDGYAHNAEEGPDLALRHSMTGKVDEKLGELARVLARRGALANRYVIVVSDHGHSPVPHNGSTWLSATAEDDPPAVLGGAGFRVRPIQLDVDEDDDFQAAIAYQGPIAYVYVADRSTCSTKGTACDWKRPPRYDEDVVPVAEAFFMANRSGRRSKKMKGSLDLVLARRPKPYAEDDLPFEVYVGGGRLVPISKYLAEHPFPTWVALESRLRDLAVGRYGERAGDVILLARNGAGTGPAKRYYFSATPMKSVHGSASRQDAEVALILAHEGKSAADLKAVTTAALGDAPRSRRVTDLVLRLRGE